MNRKCYINGIGCVSAQNTHNDLFFSEIIDYTNTSVFSVVKPEYQKYISPVSVRRMSSAVKNSIVASSIAMEESGLEDIDAIITGTGFGCLQDSEKFLKSIIDHNEDFLTPTPFIQSTHNTVAGQIALERKCKAYNFTYVNSASSFPSALLDALLQIIGGEANNILIGGVDEMASHTRTLFQTAGHFKTHDFEFDYAQNKTQGCTSSEGSAFFVLSEHMNENTYAEVLDVHFLNIISNSDLLSFVSQFLKRNNLSSDEVDTLLLGNNGDRDFETAYDEVASMFPNSNHLVYKHLFGELLTAPALALWLSCKIFKTQTIAQPLVKQAPRTESKYILIYNHYRNRDHSLILLKNV
jgi:3-oxoacyl-[acyl-carrier-protein] synthase II